MKQFIFCFLLSLFIPILCHSQRNNWDKNERKEFKKYLIDNSIITEIDDWERFISNVSTAKFVEVKENNHIALGIYKVTLPVDPETSSIYLIDEQKKYFLRAKFLEIELKLILEVLEKNSSKITKEDMIELMKKLIPIYDVNRNHKFRK